MLPAAELLAQSGIEPVYWSANLKCKQQIKKTFPNIAFHDQNEGLTGKWPSPINIDDAASALSPDLIKDYLPVQLQFMEMATTRAGGAEGFDWYELSHYYYSALAGSLALIDHLKPDVYIGITPPHYIFNYVLYEVCHRNGIKTLTFVHTHLPGKSLLVDTLDYNPNKKPNDIITNAEALKKGYKHIAELENYLVGVRASYKEGIPMLIKKNHDADNFHKYDFQQISKRIEQKLTKFKKEKYSLLFKKLTGRSAPEKKDHYLKQKGVHWSLSFRQANTYLNKRINDAKNRLTLLKIYSQYCSTICLDEKFVYIPLNMQPECTTVPQAGLYSDQLLLVKMVSAALPKNWKIYIKECPALFDWHRGSYARHKTYYDEMKSIPHVEFVALNTDPFLLIDKSQCVLCSTGTAGWEAILRSKPALMVGDLYWFKGFPGTTDARKHSDMQTFFNAIENGQTIINKEEVDRYAYSLYQKTYRCTFDKNIKAHFGISDEENAQQIAQAIIDHTKT